MKRNPRMLGRVLCLLLSLCVLLSAAPIAWATTPQQEAVLATEQRSLSNPDGTFTLPEANARRLLFHKDTSRAARLIASNVLEQLFCGNADPEALTRILAYAPLVTMEELPEEAKPDSIERYILTDGLRNLYIALRETERPGVYRIVTIHTDRSGEIYWLLQDLEYDSNTGWVYSVNGTGILQLGYEFNVKQFTSQASSNSWHRAMGFNRLYDIGAPLLGFYLDTLRFPFRYEGRDYMLQFWKGYYIASNGGEVGIYEKDPDTSFFWDTSELYLDFTMQVYQGERQLFDHSQNTWWSTGFLIGNVFNTPLLPARKLRLTGTILFEDQGMLDAFLLSFEQNRSGTMSGYADGLLFCYDWQPA